MTDDLDTTGRRPIVRTVATLTPEQVAVWEARVGPARGLPRERGPCGHPEVTRLRSVAWSWCPWCDRSPLEERGDSLLALMRSEGTTHAWALAGHLGVPRPVVTELLRWLARRGRVEVVGSVVVRGVELRLWRCA